MKKEIVYISGRMSGLPRHEVTYRFNRCEIWLRYKGVKRVKNPIRVWAWRFPWLYSTMEWLLGKERSYELVLLYDLWLLSHCTRIHMIGTDWSMSRGASVEFDYAKRKDITVTVDIPEKVNPKRQKQKEVDTNSEEL